MPTNHQVVGDAHEIKPSTSNIVADCIVNNNDSRDYEGPEGLDSTLIRAA